MPPAQLTAEKNLLQLYWLSYKFPSSKFNIYSTVLVGIVFVATLLFGEPNSGSLLLKETIKLGTAVVPSILGFLIAGFTVFVTVTKPGVFSAMAKLEYENTGESYLKYNLSAFLLAFAHYVSYLSICVLVVYFGQPNGPLTQLARLATGVIGLEINNQYRVLLGVSATIFACWTWYLIMLLKSFVYNVYQVVVTSVRWDLEHE